MCDATRGLAITVTPGGRADNIDFTLAAQVECGDSNGLCLAGDRFRVSSSWRAVPDGGTGAPAQLTADSGYFYFFEPENVEVLVKVLDGCAINGHYWFFAAGLTSLDVHLELVDSTTSECRSYDH